MSYFKHVFGGVTGYLVAPWMAGVTHELVTIRHSASVPAWADGDTHLHANSEEYYLLFEGELQLWVAGSGLTLKPNEVLMVNPGVPHAVVGGNGPIKHWVIRMPAADDRQAAGRIPAQTAPATASKERELRRDWGCRAPLSAARNQNCWLFGVGQARFPSDQMCLAYLDFPTDASAGASEHRHRLHCHQQSWEYYTTLQGTKTLQIEDQLVEIHAGEMLAVPPQIKHVLHANHTPYRGFTFRVPRLDDKVEF